MPKRAKELSAVQVKRLAKERGFHAVGGVAGLHLNIAESLASSWILRTKVGTKRRDIGLGAYPEVSLARAREKAAEVKEAVREGRDPVAERKAAREALIAAQRRTRTFRECTEALLTRKTSEFKSEKHAVQWQSTLEAYAYPVIGNLSVDDIELAHVVRVLEPIWETKTETASRVRGRIESVLAYAIASGHRKGDNVAAWKGNLDAVLPKPAKLKKIKHLASLSVGEMPGFWTRLQAQDGMGAKALQFVILTAARSGEVRGARWNEIDLEANTWTVPAGRMKAGKEHVVPLSPAAVALLRSLARNSELVFPAPRGGQLSDMTLMAVLKRMEIKATVHGFRASFKTWATEQTAYPVEVVEQALAHSLGALEKAYRRSDLLDKRRRLMLDWQKLIESRSSTDVGEVRVLRGG